MTISEKSIEVSVKKQENVETKFTKRKYYFFQMDQLLK